MVESMILKWKDSKKFKILKSNIQKLNNQRYRFAKKKKAFHS